MLKFRPYRLKCNALDYQGCEDGAWESNLSASASNKDIGIPWGKQHFKMAGLSLAPFGKDVELGF